MFGDRIKEVQELEVFLLSRGADPQKALVAAFKAVYAFGPVGVDDLFDMADNTLKKSATDS
jgi:hypothetical protein